MKNKLIRLSLYSLLISIFSCAKMESVSEWNNPLDPNGDNYFPPVVTAMNDTSVVINDTIGLYASGDDSNGDVKINVWSFDNGDSWIDTVENGELLKRVFPPEMAGDNTLLVRAIDHDGLVSPVDSVIVNVKLCPPTISPIEDMLVSKDTVIALTVTADDSNENGKVVEYLLDKGLDGFDDTSNTNLFNLSEPDGGNQSYCIAVKDDDDNIVTDTFTVRYNRPPSSVSIEDFIDKDTIFYETVNYDELKGSVKLKLESSDPDGADDTLEYSFYLWKSGDEPSLKYDGKDTELLLEDLKMAQKFNFRAVVKDLFGDSLESTGSFYTQLVDKVKPVISLIGDNPLILPKYFEYQEYGCTASDEIDGDLTDSVKISGDDINSSVAGSYEVVYTVADNSGNEASITREVIVEDFIMLDDFEGGKTYQTLFGSLFEDTDSNDSTGYWRYWTDSGEGGNTIITPEVNAGTDSSFKENHIEGAGVDGSTALNINVMVGDAIQYPYWGIGLYLKNSAEYYDLSGMDSLVFYAKGSIELDDYTYRVQFTYESIDEQWFKWGYAGVELTLSSEWERVVITPDELLGVDSSPGHGHTWEDIKSGIKMIQFCSEPDADQVPDIELYIDDIKLYGDFEDSGLF